MSSLQGVAARDRLHSNCGSWCWDESYFFLALVAAGRDEDKGERLSTLAVAVLIDAGASLSNQKPGVDAGTSEGTQAWRRQNHHPNPLVCSCRPAVGTYRYFIRPVLSARDLRIR